jgi:hypothetical protein
MFRFVRFLAWAGVTLLLAACANSLFNPGPRSYIISQAQLLDIIAKRFPFNERVAELLDLQAVAPRIKLLPESNRIATELDVNLTERLLRTAFKGSLAMNYGLRFEPSDNSIRMTDVKVSSLVVDGVPDRYQNLVGRLAPVLAERLLNDFSLHQISAKDLGVVNGWGYAPGGFQVTPQGLSISLTPRKAP